MAIVILHRIDKSHISIRNDLGPKKLFNIYLFIFPVFIASPVNIDFNFSKRFISFQIMDYPRFN